VEVFDPASTRVKQIIFVGSVFFKVLQPGWVYSSSMADYFSFAPAEVFFIPEICSA
jgi:hypothetical protein